MIGRHDGAVLYAEDKGHTASPGLDVDTLYGQLLRRIPPDAVRAGILAVVVPDSVVTLAERVPAAVRAALGIHIYAVTEDGRVGHIGDGIDPAILTP